MKIYLTLLVSCIGFHLSAQTFLGPTIGYDFATLETQSIFIFVEDETNNQMFPYFTVERAEKDTPSGRRSILFGFQVQKILSQRWTLGLRGSYSKKKYFAHIYNSNPFAIPTFELFYRHINISVLFNRKIKDKISFGIGPNISHFSGWNSVNEESRLPTFSFGPYQITKRGYGLDLQLGYYLGPVYLALDYTKMLKISDASGYMTGASSLTISGTYLFELKKRK